MTKTQRLIVDEMNAGESLVIQRFWGNGGLVNGTAFLTGGRTVSRPTLRALIREGVITRDENESDIYSVSYVLAG